jgi:superfamily II DNA helicase RecQ
MTKNETEKLSDFLRDHEVSADYYHAGMTKSSKQNVQAAWLEGKILIVCATIAYGTHELSISPSVPAL